jgi:hypothetical protein
VTAIKMIQSRLALLVMALLIVLSVEGAFMGADRAKSFFNSPVMGVFWISLLVLLAVAIVSSRLVARQGGVLAMHLGLALVLIGAMWGSRAGHRLANGFLGQEKIPAGYMVIPVGGRENMVLDEDLAKDVGQLGFSLELRDFRVEYYPPRDKTWRLLAAMPLAGRDDQNQGNVDAEPIWLDWRIGQTLTIPGVSLRVKVLDYLDSARPSDIDPSTAVADQAVGAPAMKLSIQDPPGRPVETWLIAAPGEDHIGLSVAAELGVTSAPAGGPEWINRAINLWLVQPESPVKAYTGDVAVVVGDKAVKSQAVQVNRPLHYGGYHIYLHQWETDPQEQGHAVFAITSDSGLGWVFAGLAVLCLGAMWHFWAAPAIAYVRGPGNGV